MGYLCSNQARFTWFHVCEASFW